MEDGDREIEIEIDYHRPASQTLPCHALPCMLTVSENRILICIIYEHHRSRSRNREPHFGYLCGADSAQPGSTQLNSAQIRSAQLIACRGGI